MITPWRAAAFMTASAFSFGTDHNSVLVRVRARPDAEAARCLIAAYSLRRRERSPARPTVTPRRDAAFRRASTWAFVRVSARSAAEAARFLMPA